MSQTVLNQQITSRAGTQVSFVAFDNANGMAVQQPGTDLFLAVVNDAGAAVNLTIHCALTIDGNLAVADRVESIPFTNAGAVLACAVFGPFAPGNPYVQSDGTIRLDCPTAGVLIAAFVRGA